MTGSIRWVHAAVAWLFLASLVVQVFLAGLGIFGDPATLATHREFGYTVVGLAVLALVIVTAVARPARRDVWLTLAILVLYVVQTVLPTMRSTLPAVAALHPVNALILFLLATVVARRATAAARSGASPAAA